MKWTAREIARLRRLYPSHTNAEIAKRMGRTEPSIMQRAIKLGLKKPAGWNAGFFQKGQTPWNKGKPHPSRGRSVETQFQPGNKPQTWKPLGSERLSKDGYRERKVADTGYGPRDWRPVHVLWWERYRGPVPKGHAVVFRNGDKTDIRMANLECISRQELMRRNSVHRLPKELARAVQLVGALNRQINARMG